METTLPHKRIYALPLEKLPLDEQGMTIYAFEVKRLSLIIQLDQLSWMILNLYDHLRVCIYAFEVFHS